ncbi:hypothetical protein KKF84_00105, partial [Myxococcota bacterium]|nr:hypothetical protein [Myxococcota bacterium]
MGTFLPRWVLTYRYSFAVALLFFVGALFVGNAETLISGELGFAAVNHSVAPSPGSPLHTILAQPFLLLPLGSVIFRLTLYAITTCAMVLFFFGVFLERRVSSRVVVIMVLVAIALSGIFFRNTLMVSDIPLTLLFILVMFHVVDLRSPLADLRMPLLLVFLTGLGCGGLHPSLRFLLPPMIILWLTTLRVAPRLFAAIPLFFLLGFGVVLFLPLSLGGFDHVSTIRGPGGLFSYLGTRSQGAPESGVFSFPLFFSNLKIMVEYLSDSFPFFLVPLAGAGVYYGFLSIYRRDFMTFFGIGVAAFLYTAWMVPDQIPQGGTGLISLFALWCAVAVGTVGLFGRWGARIWSDMGMALILLITILAIVLNMGESPRPQGSDHRALLREMVRKSKGKG